VVYTKEEKLAKAKEALHEPESLVAHLDDRQKGQFFKLLARKMGMEYGDLGSAEKALELERHYRVMAKVR
jgi:hypothetical protein